MSFSAVPRGMPALRGVARSRGAAPHGMSATLVTGAFILLWIGCAIAGGSARADSPGLLLQRPVTVACLFVFLAASTPRDWRSVRVPLILLGLFAAIMLAQLVPLPPGIWHALPGRERFAAALTLAGSEGAWLPLSVAPDRTWNSLAALFTPAAVLIGYALLPTRARDLTLPALIVFGLANTLLGVVQLSGGESSPFYVYPQSSVGYPIGFLANRNHAGALLAALIPALRAWSLEEPTAIFTRGRRAVIAAAFCLFLVPTIFATGSRAGLGLLVVGIVAAWLVKPVTVDPRRIPLRVWLAIGAGLLLAGLALWAVLASGRAIAVDRLFSDSVSSDLRFDFAPVIVGIIRAGFPVGWGFGTFDPVFRSFEPDQALRLMYFNNAHDDLLELLLTGGAAAALVLLALLAWLARRAAAGFRAGRRPGVFRVRAAVLMIAMLLLASLVDYPLRTPLIGAIFTLLCGWAADVAPDGTRVASKRKPL